jgi:hypothetical protein
VDIDMSALRGLVREKEIAFDVLVEAIESALLIAYHRTEGSRRRARVELDKQTGHVTVWAREDVQDLADAEDNSPQAGLRKSKRLLAKIPTLAQPLTENFAWRQTQTAWTARIYWVMKFGLRIGQGYPARELRLVRELGSIMQRNGCRNPGVTGFATTLTLVASELLLLFLLLQQHFSAE